MKNENFAYNLIPIQPRTRSIQQQQTTPTLMVSFNEIAGNALLFFLVFGMSATVDINMLLLQLKNVKALFMGVVLQFAILPVLGFLVVKYGGLDRSAGISLLVVTSSPGGSYSNW